VASVASVLDDFAVVVGAGDGVTESCEDREK
jgi:hypothetical protein